MSDLQPTHSCGMSVCEGLTSEDEDYMLESIGAHYGTNGVMRAKERSGEYKYGISMPPLISLVDVRGEHVESCADALIEKIIEEKLGTVWSSEWVYNHGNDVRSITWCVDRSAFAKWAYDNVKSVKEKSMKYGGWAE